MSLINEALKRTRDSAYQPVTPPPTAPEYRLQSHAKSRGAKDKLLVTVVIGGLAIAGIIVLASRHATRVPDAKPTVAEATRSAPETPSALTPAAPQKTDATPSPPPAVEPPMPSPPPDPKISEDQIVARVMERMKAGPPIASEPKLVLQGITYAKDDSEAMINGITLRVGEDIEGARVVAIESRRVKLDFSGHEIVLRLP